jgi:3-methyladenine DNA glycosylase AlkD
MNDYTDFPALLEERYSEKISFTLIRDDAKEFSRSHSLEECCDMGLALYESGNYQVQEAGVFMLGDCAAENDDALLFLRDTVSRHDNWRIQEVLAKAFDSYCRLTGYEHALPVIENWLESDCPNTRRAVSEGLRIWTSRPYFKENPQAAVQLLSAHKEDDSSYMRKSVGNALRDISKKHPELIAEELRQWDISSSEIRQVYALAGKFINKR